METTVPFTVNIIGQRTNNPYTGKFTVKTILSRRENFLADERRRFILGMNPAGAPPALQGEAYMLGVLAVRLIEVPDWWKNSDGGLDIEDENVIGEVYKLAMMKVEEREKELQDNAAAALEKMSKKTVSTSKQPKQE